MPSYMISRERLEKFRVGTEVEATKFADEKYFGLKGKIVFVKNVNGFRGFVVDWYDPKAEVAAKVRPYARHLHTPYELKLAEEEWDDWSDLPEMPAEQVEMGGGEA